METLQIESAKEIAGVILFQLGAKRFLAMTGSKNLMWAGGTDTTSNVWLRMDLVKNNSKANRLKIMLMDDDTYTVEFYHFKLKGVEPIHTIVDITMGAHAEDLRPIFEKVTGLRTSL